MTEQTTPRHSRASVLRDESIVETVIQDGMTVAIGGFINAEHPMSLVRALIRAGRRDLVIVGAASAGLEVDLLIAAGVARQVITPYVGAEGLASIGPAFRKAMQDGDLAPFEIDEAMYYAGLRAAAQGVSFNPWRAGVGTSYPDLNQALVPFRSPINDELLLAIPAINIEVALIHAARSDVYGNVQHRGHGYGDRAIAAAADITIVSVESLVSNEEIRAQPSATSIAGATYVVRAPFGAHPFGADGHYAPDKQEIGRYVDVATTWLRTADRDPLDEYISERVLKQQTHLDYLDLIGVHQLMNLSEY